MDPARRLTIEDYTEMKRILNEQYKEAKSKKTGERSLGRVSRSRKS